MNDIDIINLDFQGHHINNRTGRISASYEQLCRLGDGATIALTIEYDPSASPLPASLGPLLRFYFRYMDTRDAELLSPSQTGELPAPHCWIEWTGIASRLGDHSFEICGQGVVAGSDRKQELFQLHLNRRAR